MLDNDEALIAGLIVMEPLGVVKSRNFHRFMADAGDLDVSGVNYARMQMLTVEDILDGKGFNTSGLAWLNLCYHLGKSNTVILTLQ